MEKGLLFMRSQKDTLLITLWNSQVLRLFRSKRTDETCDVALKISCIQVICVFVCIVYHCHLNVTTVCILPLFFKEHVEVSQYQSINYLITWYNIPSVRLYNIFSVSRFSNKAFEWWLDSSQEASEPQLHIKSDCTACFFKIYFW